MSVFCFVFFHVLVTSLSHVTIGLGAAVITRQSFHPFFFPSIFYSKRKKCLVTSTNEFFFSCYCLRGSSGLDEDSTVSVEFEDLAQPLLGRCHPFFGPLACKENGQNVVMASI